MKVGDYVRTPLGITKYLGKYNMLGDLDNWYEFDKLDENLWFGDIADVINKNQLNEVVIKSSPNIIDLIEKGDILKFKDTKHYQEVLAIDNEKLYLTDFIYMSGLHKYKKEIQEDLEWVITQEQIEAIQYEVK